MTRRQAIAALRMVPNCSRTLIETDQPTDQDLVRTSIVVTEADVRPKNVARDFLLFRLAEAAPAVIGRRPTATANGRFVRLCAAVVVACGFDDRGIERAVEKAIKELSKQQRKGFRRIPRPPATPTQTGSTKS